MARPNAGQLNLGSTTILAYPDNLGNKDAASQHFMRIKAYKTGYFSGGKEADDSPNLDIALFIPPNALKTSFSSKYETFEGFEQSIKKLGEKAISTGHPSHGSPTVDEFVGDITGSIMNAGEKAMADFGGSSVAFGALKGMVLEKSKVAQAALIGGGIAANPYLSVFFKGLGDFRTSSLSFDFIARNQHESVAIDKIVGSLTNRMLPGKVSSSAHSYFLKYPDQFKIEYFINGQSWNKMKLKRQVLTGLSVDYAGQGIPLFFKDVGEPFNVKLELAFQEISLITREDFNEYGSTAT